MMDKRRPPKMQVQPEHFGETIDQRIRKDSRIPPIVSSALYQRVCGLLSYLAAWNDLTIRDDAEWSLKANSSQVPDRRTIDKSYFLIYN
jgi:hypothetical protein